MDSCGKYPRNKYVIRMKVNRIYNILSVLLGGMLVSMSCHREDVPGTAKPVDGGEPIEFSSVYASVEVKADTREATPLPASFMVWASRTANSATNYNVFGEDGTTVRNTGTSDSQKWVYSPVRYWQSGDYNFVAVTPVDLALSGELTAAGLELNFGSWNLIANPTDALVATSDVSNDVVPLTFGHLLSKISFSAKTIHDTPIEITSIKISGHHKDAKSTVLSGVGSEWEFNDDGTASQDIKSSVSASYTLTGTSTKVSSDVLVFPENCSLTVDVTIRHSSTAGGYPKSATISSTNWLSGQKYDYVINVGPDRISFSEPIVSPWVNSGDIADEGIEF